MATTQIILDSNGSREVSFTPESSANEAIDFNNDGTKLYVLSSTSDKIYEHTLSTPYDISTETYNSVYYDMIAGPAVGGTITGMAWASDGFHFYFSVDEEETIYQIDII